MEGGELNDSKNTERIRTEGQICEIMKTLTDALDYCHTNNIVHRDIKVIIRLLSLRTYYGQKKERMESLKLLILVLLKFLIMP